MPCRIRSKNMVFLVCENFVIKNIEKHIDTCLNIFSISVGNSVILRWE